MSSTTHFARCVSAAKSRARGFWAWVPEVRGWLRPREGASPPAPECNPQGYGAVIAAAAARAQAFR